MTVPLLTTDERLGLVRAIHDTPTMLVLAVAGGGNAAITDLLDVPGASRTVLEARVPYAASAMAELLALDDDEPFGVSEAAGAVSVSTAQTMAEACLERAHHLAPEHLDVIGVACTAALVTDRPKKGEHRAHVAIARGDSRHRSGPPVDVAQRKIELEKGLRDRAGEDRVVADAIVIEIARACGLTTELAGLERP